MARGARVHLVDWSLTIINGTQVHILDIEGRNRPHGERGRSRVLLMPVAAFLSRHDLLPTERGSFSIDCCRSESAQARLSLIFVPDCPSPLPPQQFVAKEKLGLPGAEFEPIPPSVRNSQPELGSPSEIRRTFFCADVCAFRKMEEDESGVGADFDVGDCFRGSPLE